MGANEFPSDERQPQPQQPSLPVLPPLEDGTAGQVPVKKKRGRPKKIRTDGVIPVKQEQSNVAAQASSSSSTVPGINGEFVNGQPPKKKRGRPKKIRTEEVRPVPQMDGNGGCSNSFGGSSSSNQSHLENRGPQSASPAPTYMNHSFVNNQPSVINHPASQQQHPHAVDYYGRAPSNIGGTSVGGPLSGLCNDMSPHQSTSSTPQPTTSSPRQMEFDPGYVHRPPRGSS